MADGLRMGRADGLPGRCSISAINLADCLALATTEDDVRFDRGRARSRCSPPAWEPGDEKRDGGPDRHPASPSAVGDRDMGKDFVARSRNHAAELLQGASAAAGASAFKDLL